MQNKFSNLFTFRRKIIILILLLIVLASLSIAVWAKNDYERARQESLRHIEESGGQLPSNEEIEFNAPEEADLDYMNVLLIGIDDDEDIARTDTIMIAQYHPEKGTAKLVSLMRDMYVTIPGHGQNKINAAFSFGGLELLRQTIKENFDVDVHYYAQVDFNGFERIVDTLAPEGIEIDVERRMYYETRSLVIDFQPGLQTMSGDEALKYVRFRSDFENDFGRVRRQQQVLDSLSGELLSISGVRRIPQLLGSIEPYIQTNIDTSKMISYGRSFVLNPVDDIETITIPLSDAYYDETFSHAGAVLMLDWDRNKEALHEFLGTELMDDNNSTFED
ncbi:LCP family protein [Evansella cellulosilytica]|uniref:Regulatory protein MsrR n=1 Tax=Evansella cellulosilytica (strain ATCC 21833 / DSM 2522 / FERM P-1141 / JCM 9156 / N-4) TaxID=649639 RepID=E6TXV8_EVAC2|nr:LCP family protein [Evansella cellulosilytica]ADU31171.1 cell envelope-related transcriptional attenuator [Evansella cellulosilytica DSM 2522]